ncbi:MAG: hypothetical protein RIE08_09140 [Acidimicrobiales bacterium]
MADRPTFVVIWNPEIWPASNRDKKTFRKEWTRTVRATRRKKATDVVWGWSFGRATENSDIQVGDRVFFLRVGESEERGFLAAGRIHSDSEGSPVWFDAHWHGTGKPQAYVDMRLDSAVPLDDPLSKATVDAAIHDIAKPLKIQSSGTRLKPDVADRLERLWAAHTGGASATPKIEFRQYDPETVEALRPRRKKGAKKIERRVQDRYAIALGKARHEVTRPAYTIDGIPGKKLADLFDRKTNTLIEAKVRPQPAVVAAAIEQLREYASFHPDSPNLELLFARKPKPAELELILSQGIRCTWPSSSSTRIKGFRSAEPEGWR